MHLAANCESDLEASRRCVIVAHSSDAVLHSSLATLVASDQPKRICLLVTLQTDLFRDIGLQAFCLRDIKTRVSQVFESKVEPISVSSTFNLSVIKDTGGVYSDHRANIVLCEDTRVMGCGMVRSVAFTRLTSEQTLISLNILPRSARPIQRSLIET